MKQIKINFVGFWNTLNKTNNIFFNLLSKYFDVIISDNPDYLFVSCFNGFLDHFNYPNAIKIFYSGEDISPDFNFFDYCIGYNDFLCGDRYLQFPVYLHHETLKEFNLSKISNNEANECIKKKDIFCNLIYKEDRFDNKRSLVFKLLNQYKKVESFGELLNNQKNNMTVSYINIEEKFSVLRRSKFTIAADSVDLDDFVTEKIHHAILCNTIPIYIGTNKITKYYNKDRFINCNDFNSLEEMVDYVIKIDKDDALYLKMITAEPLVDCDYIKNRYCALDSFLFNIFNKNLTDAYKRPLTGKIIKSWTKEMSEYRAIRLKPLVRIERKINRSKHK